MTAVAGDTKRVLIVDDSASLRAWLRMVLRWEPKLEVVGEAADAFEARQKTLELKPDVITLDVEMPKVSGLAFLERLMEKRPMPVVMVSATTAVGSTAALDALSLGAVDCIEKPVGLVDDREQKQIARRVLAAANSRLQPRGKAIAAAPKVAVSKVAERNMPVVLVGASTGGVAALEVFLAGLDANGPPVVVVQHMPGQFLASFAQRLNRQLSRPVGLASEGGSLCRGDIVFAPAEGKHTELSLIGGIWKFRQRENTEDALHCPSVDVLFHSAAKYGARIVGALLTGLGRDGGEGMLALHQNGAKTVCQNEETCVIYGMPKTARELGAVDHELPLQSLAAKVNALAGAMDTQIGHRQHG